MLEVVTQRLVRHELYVARYYLLDDNFKAAVARCDYALDNYPGSGLDAEAMVLKGETLLKWHKPEGSASDLRDGHRGPRRTVRARREALPGKDARHERQAGSPGSRPAGSRSAGSCSSSG